MPSRFTWILIAVYLVSVAAALLPQRAERIGALTLVFLFLWFLQGRVFRWAGKWRSAAFRDALTGLANFRYFEKTLRQEVVAARRAQKPLTLVLLDLDGFKQFNDRHGHPAGNDCLREVGNLLRRSSREGIDVSARFGGDEFALLLPGVAAEAAERVVERLREKIAGTFLGLSVSAGIQEYGGEPLREFLQGTDARLYREKKRRNQLAMETPPSQSERG